MDGDRAVVFVADSLWWSEKRGEMPDRERLLRVVICFPRVDITSGESE